MCLYGSTYFESKPKLWWNNRKISIIDKNKSACTLCLILLSSAWEKFIAVI